ncbi:T9SS type A sorting domain-containing protein [Flavobacterium sp. CYK-4]|uniref:DUF7619 domain-containing protein n=1 Tax=Flavobacterium lotistagni TaxID=2709660 RepID=UPI00140DBEE0|nr:T9SS type A sorting domain-containing protein [Flavobacterium lotistagni]NHM06479.1 T9SS type A sorting domain-containing protein [Flavobacterium lotistagni]
MKNVFLPLLLVGFMSQAQVVDIPDANFKSILLAANTDNEIAYANGSLIRIDANSDGEIQETEAAAVDSLSIFSSQISSLNGLGSFVNLKSLNCEGNQINTVDLTGLSLLSKLKINNNQLSSLDVSSLANLQELYASANLIASFATAPNANLKHIDLNNNSLTAINLNGLTNLQILKLNYNQLPSIDLSGLTALQGLYLNHNLLTQLDIASLTQLLQLDCSYNSISALPGLNNLSQLSQLDCSYNTISSINFTGLTALQYLNYSGNNLVSLDVSSLTGLMSLICSDNALTSIDLSALTGLLYFEGSFNDFASLDFSGNTALANIICDHNPLTAIDVSMLPNLTRLNISSNALTQIDLSQNPLLFEFFATNNSFSSLNFNANSGLYYIDVSENNTLASIFMNNGTFNQGAVPGYLGVANCPNIEYVCVQEEGIGYVNNQLQFTSGASNVVVNSYCSFSPSGDYNLIKGKITYDAFADGCDASDSIFPNLRVNLTDGTNSGANFIDAQGNYSFVTQTGSFTVSPSIQHPEWFIFSPPSAVVNFSDNENNQQTVDFCLAPLGVHRDVSVVLAPANHARPGDTASYQIVYTNNGNQLLSGAIDFNFNDDVLNLIFSSDTPAQVQPGILTWNYTNLQPFESRRIDLAFSLNAASDTPAVNIGDVLNFSAAILPVADDEIPQDNTFAFSQTVVDADILNDIICLEGTVLDPSYIGQYLHYMINFENVGTLAATNTVIRFEVDTNIFDLSTLQLLDASNNVETQITGNVVEFIFQNINLEIGGHGHILLKMKTLENLPESTVVSNRASVYYDLNAPLDTPTVNTVFQTLSSVDFLNEASVVLFPNPASNEINVLAKHSIESITLYNLQGSQIGKNVTNGKEVKINLNQYPSGVYLVKVVTSKGVLIEKLVKR